VRKALAEGKIIINYQGLCKASGMKLASIPEPQPNQKLSKKD